MYHIYAHPAYYVFICVNKDIIYANFNKICFNTLIKYGMMEFCNYIFMKTTIVHKHILDSKQQ